MILGIGNDAVEIERFSRFAHYTKRQLTRLFSEHEIGYCLSEPTKSAERFAARFAAKEALYKALCQTAPHCRLNFLKLCKYAQIERKPAPAFCIAWNRLDLPTYSVLVSITHTQSLAPAQGIVQEIA